VEQWIEIAKGPLFALTFMMMVLGLGREVVLQLYTLVRGKGKRLMRAPWGRILSDTVSWILPVRHLIPGTVVFSIASFVFHVGVILVPLFLMDHIVLWEGFLGIDLPHLGNGMADFLTLLTLSCVLVLLVCRISVRRQRSMSKLSDYLILLVILLVFVTGFLAAHPGINPLPWEIAMLVHILSAELLFVIIPFTKLAHIVLFAFNRISPVHWQLRPEAGDRVAESLYGKEARV
jgi:nitrate reductase gamma subunit